MKDKQTKLLQLRPYENGKGKKQTGKKGLAC